MRRREFIVLLGAAGSAPFLAKAQQPKLPLVAFLSSTSAEPYKPFVDAIFVGLREQGYVAGTNFTVEFRWAEGRYEQLPAFATELVHLRPAVIIAIAPPAARAAKAATSSIPIIFSTSGDPVALGLVSSINRPDSNLTGVYFQLFATSAKRIELLTSILPTANTIGLLANPANPSTAQSVSEAQSAAATLGRKLLVADASTAQAIETEFRRLVEQNVQAVSVEADPFLLASRDQIVAQAGLHALPTIYPHREYVHAGGLISYGNSLVDGYRQIGAYTGRILHGEKLTNLPVLLADKFELLINTKAAKALGIVVPPHVLALADEVIE